MAMKFLGFVIVTIAILYLAQLGTRGVASPWLRETLGFDRDMQVFFSQAYMPVAIVVFIFGVLAFTYFRKK